MSNALKVLLNNIKNELYEPSFYLSEQRKSPLIYNKEIKLLKLQVFIGKYFLIMTCHQPVNLISCYKYI